MKAILDYDFKTIIPLAEWQKTNGLNSDHISNHIVIGIDNVLCDREIILSRTLIDVFESLREQFGKPIKINSGYRTQKKQEELKAEGYRAAVTSPHVRGYALDIDYTTNEELVRILRILRPIPGIRIGWRDYKNAGQTFVHLDVAPAAFAALNDKTFPVAWRSPGLEW